MKNEKILETIRDENSYGNDVIHLRGRDCSVHSSIKDYFLTAIYPNGDRGSKALQPLDNVEFIGKYDPLNNESDSSTKDQIDDLIARRYADYLDLSHLVASSYYLYQSMVRRKELIVVIEYFEYDKYGDVALADYDIAVLPIKEFTHPNTNIGSISARAEKNSRAENGIARLVNSKTIK